jgi:hypothetical protein
MTELESACQVPCPPLPPDLLLPLVPGLLVAENVKR